MGRNLMLLATMLIGGAFAQVPRWIPTEQWLRSSKPSQRPIKGCVPDKGTAISVGKAVMTGAFGKDFADGAEPIDAKLFGDVWVVYSHFEPRDKNGRLNLGGPTTVEISRTSGAVLSLVSER